MDARTIEYYERHADKSAAIWETATGAEKYFSVAFPGGSRLLDIGSGSGRNAAVLLNGGYDVRGIEPSTELRNASLARHPELADRITSGSLPSDLDEVGTDNKFDGVLCSAVFEHLPKNQLFDAVYAIKNCLNPHGRVLVSLSMNRNDLDESGREATGRLFTRIIPDELSLLFERIGFQCIGRWSDDDTLGRKLKWTTLLFELGSVGIARPLDMVEAVLSKDKKVATYKLALFRALCDIALTQSHSVKWRDDGMVQVPIDAVAERWILYYWPLFESSTFLPQMNGEWDQQTHKLAFASELSSLIGAYNQSGGLCAYAVDRRKRSLPDSAKAVVTALKRKLRQAIKTGPVTYAGGSLKAGPIFQYARGNVLVSPALWKELCLMGHWIQDALILRWAEKTSVLSKGSLQPDVVVARLLIAPDPERETQAAKELFKRLPDIKCVWSGRPLGSDIVIDHVLPFALWRNNDLWNLLPTHAKVNSQKSDKLPTRRLLQDRHDPIFSYWNLSRDALPERFNAEAAAQTGIREPEFADLFDVMVESVEVTALQRGCERWEP